jgi:O-antigen/teichoic acid export membrane protein
VKTNIRKTVAKNFTVLFGAKIITWISGFVLLLFLPRYLGSEDYGRLYLALSIKMILGIIVDFGGGYLIPKEVARSQETGNHILNNYLLLRVLLWICCIGIILLISHLLGYSSQVRLLILVLSVSLLWEGIYKGYKSYFQGIERMEYPSLGGIARRIFVAVFAVAALLLGAHSLVIAVIMTAGSFLYLLIIIWFSRSYTTFSFKLDGKLFSLLQASIPYFLFSLFGVIYYRVDAIMLSSFTNDTVTGWYGGAYRFFDIVMVLPLIYQTVIYPVFSKLWKDQTGVLEQTIGKSLKLIIAIGILVSLLVFLFAKNIIGFFMGLQEYSSSVIILKIFALSVPVVYIDFIIGNAIVGAANRQSAWAAVTFCAILLNVGANYLLIPYTQAAYINGGIGAAVATFITEIFIFAMVLYLAPRKYFKTFKAAYITKPAAAGVVITVFLWLLRSTHLYWMLSAGAGMILYLAILYFSKLFDEDELTLLKEIMSVQKIKMFISSRNS